MSTPAKITLGIAVTISSAIIGYVHYKQSNDRFKLHEGVLRDVEQQKRRKNENTYQLQQQLDMAKHFRAMENEKQLVGQYQSNLESNSDTNEPTGSHADIQQPQKQSAQSPTEPEAINSQSSNTTKFKKDNVDGAVNTDTDSNN